MENILLNTAIIYFGLGLLHFAYMLLFSKKERKYFLYYMDLTSILFNQKIEEEYSNWDYLMFALATSLLWLVYIVSKEKFDGIL